MLSFLVLPPSIITTLSFLMNLKIILNFPTLTLYVSSNPFSFTIPCRINGKAFKEGDYRLNFSLFLFAQFFYGFYSFSMYNNPIFIVHL